MSESGDDIQETDTQDTIAQGTEVQGEESRQNSSDGISRLPGELLTEAREKQGLSRIRVSELLGLTQSAIRDIELNRFERFPSGIYVRGYLRNYCKLVVADEQQVMDAYDEYGRTNEVPEESPFGGAALLEADQSSGKRRVILITVFVAVLIIGTAALVIF